MRAMKDSGVEWIGEIPEKWRTSRLKFVLESPLQYGANSAGVEYNPTLPRYIRITDITRDCQLTNYGMLSLNRDEAADYILHDKDILLARSGATAGKAFLYRIEYGFSAFAGYLIRARLKKSVILPEYAYYTMQGTGYEQWKHYVATQATIPNIGADKYNEYVLPIPLVSEQKAIVVYLDQRCGEIDKVLTKTRESIEEYKKLKQSVITEAVTKGIRPNRPMKPSGIEWIGDIPAEWEVRPFRTVLSERNEKNSPAKTDERLSLSIDLGVTKYAEKTTNLDRFKEDVTQYKLAYPGDLVMNSMNMIVGAVGVSPYFGCVSPAYYTYFDKSASKSAARFCDFLFRTRILRRVLRSLGKGIYSIERGDDRVNTCRLKVSREDLRALKIPVPMATEQQEIVAYLDQQCAEIDRLIAKKEQIISELEGYKKSLIYECVTGKREVAEKRNLVDIFGKAAKLTAKVAPLADLRTQQISAEAAALSAAKVNFDAIKNSMFGAADKARTQRMLGDISRLTPVSPLPSIQELIPKFELPPIPPVPDSILQSTRWVSGMIEEQRKMFELPPFSKMPDDILQSTRWVSQMIDDQRKMLQPFQADFKNIAQMLQSTAAWIGSLTSFATVHSRITKDWDAIWKTIHIPVKPEIQQKKRAAHKRWAEFGWSCHPNIEFSEIPPESAEVADKFMMQELENYGISKFIEELSQLVTPNRQKRFDDALFNFQHDRFVPCVMVMYALIEGEFIIRQPKEERSNGKPKNRHLAKGAAEVFVKELDESETAEKILDRIPRFFYRCENMFYAVITFFESANDFRDEDETVGLNRNFVDHGMSQRQAEKKHCLQLFLLYYNILSLFAFYDYIWPIKDERWLPTEKNDAESGRDAEDSE